MTHYTFSATEIECPGRRWQFAAAIDEDALIAALQGLGANHSKINRIDAYTLAIVILQRKAEQLLHKMIDPATRFRFSGFDTAESDLELAHPVYKKGGISLWPLPLEKL